METSPRHAQAVSMDSLENPRTPPATGSNKDVEMELNIQQGLIMAPDAPTSSQDIGGMMKIVPSELDVSLLPCISFCSIFVENQSGYHPILIVLYVFASNAEFHFFVLHYVTHVMDY